MGNITIIATGGTRAPFQLELADRFRGDGHDVRCIASKNALRFLTSHIARRPRRLLDYARLYRPQMRETFAYYNEHPKSVPHVSEGKWADVVVMCPASCNSVGKLAAGMNDNYALLVLRAVPRDKRVIVVPSMNTEMWFDPQFQRNVDALNATEKYRVLCPGRGEMLSGDHGFGAQAEMEEIVEETYAALGLADEDVAAALSGRASVPWRDDSDVDPATCLEVALVDEDEQLRRRVRTALLDDYTNIVIHEFATPAEVLVEFADRDPALIFTEAVFSGGMSVDELIDHYRAPGRGDAVQIVVTTAADRQSAGAEALARREVYFLPKPLNINYTVGLIAGALQGEQRVDAVERRRLAAEEVLFEQGDSGDTLFLVESGSLRVLRSTNGTTAEVRRIGRGEFAGAMSLFNEGIRTATVAAAEPSTILAVKIEHSWEYIERQPEWLRTLKRRSQTECDRPMTNASQLRPPEPARRPTNPSDRGTMTRDIHYFAYGTLQRGLSNYADLTDVLGEPVGRFRTAESFAVVVPERAGCSNPGCNLLHRMATLVPDFEQLRVEGDVYAIDADGLRIIDRLENYDGEDGSGPYVRREIDVIAVDGDERLAAQAYRVREPDRWRALIDAGRASAVERYTAEMATSTPKACCVRRPGHDGPHDTIDPFAHDD